VKNKFTGQLLRADLPDLFYCYNFDEPIIISLISEISRLCQKSLVRPKFGSFYRKQNQITNNCGETFLPDSFRLLTRNKIRNGIEKKRVLFKRNNGCFIFSPRLRKCSRIDWTNFGRFKNVAEIHKS